MSGENDTEKGFKVEDRRTSSSAESPPGSEEKEGLTEEKGSGETEPAEEPAAEGSATGPGAGEASAPGSEVPRVDFSTFVLSLFSSALIQMGEMADPITGKSETNLDAAKQTIDILDVLKEKTAGNLTEEEGKFLENASAELKWKFLNAVKQGG